MIQRKVAGGQMPKSGSLTRLGKDSDICKILLTFPLHCFFKYARFRLLAAPARHWIRFSDAVIHL